MIFTKHHLFTKFNKFKIYFITLKYTIFINFRKLFDKKFVKFKYIVILLKIDKYIIYNIIIYLLILSITI